MNLENLLFLQENQITDLVDNHLPEVRKVIGNRLTFFDVGAAGSIHPITQPLRSLIRGVLFEPDDNEYKNLISNSSDFTKVYKYALGEKEGSLPFYVCEASTNNSNLQTNQKFIERYNAQKFQVKHKLTVDVYPLDTLIQRGLVVDKPDIMKVDTQGTELSILKGAKRALSENILCLLLEAEFFEVYSGQPTISEIIEYLKDFGFFLYGLYPRYRSTKKFKKVAPITEERLMWADCVFLKDPIQNNHPTAEWNENDITSLVLICLMLGFYDFALELSDKFLSTDQDKWKLVVECLSNSRLAHMKNLLDNSLSGGDPDIKDALTLCTILKSNTDVHFEAATAAETHR